MRECYYDADGCLVCPELPAVPERPNSVRATPNLGWNAGANTVAMIAGDVHVKDSFDSMPAGTTIGFRTVRTRQTNPALILHGFYFYRVANKNKVEVRESGKAAGEVMTYVPGTVWEIRRVGHTVSYWLGGVQVRATRAATMAPVLVTACLYTAGDTVP